MKQLSSYDLLSSCRCHLSSWTPLSQSTTIGLFSMVGANSVVPYIRMETTLCIVEDVFAKLMSSFVSARIKVVHWTGRRPTVFLLMAPSRLPISIHGHSAYISMRRQFSQSFTLCQKIWTVPVDCGALLNHSAGTQKSRRLVAVTTGNNILLLCILLASSKGCCLNPKLRSTDIAYHAFIPPWNIQV